MAPSDRDFVPPFSEGRFALMKSMLPFLPPDAARLFLPLCQMMELKELLAKFEWERAHLLSVCQTPKPFDTASLLESLRASLPPEQSEQLEQMMQMAEMMQMMQESGAMGAESADTCSGFHGNEESS